MNRKKSFSRDTVKLLPPFEAMIGLELHLTQSYRFIPAALIGTL